MSKNNKYSPLSSRTNNGYNNYNKSLSNKSQIYEQINISNLTFGITGDNNYRKYNNGNTGNMSINSNNQTQANRLINTATMSKNSIYGPVTGSYGSVAGNYGSVIGNNMNKSQLNQSNQTNQLNQNSLASGPIVNGFNIMKKKK